MKVLSLFDGCGCVAQALKDIGIPIDLYATSDVDTAPSIVFFQ